MLFNLIQLINHTNPFFLFLFSVEVNDFCKIQRSCSIYDNVDINESIEAAKRLSELTTNSDQRGFFKLQITLS